MNKMEGEKSKNMKVKCLKQQIQRQDLKKQAKGITLIALVITILFSYDEKIKCSNSKGFLLQTI